MKKKSPPNQSTKTSKKKKAQNLAEVMESSNTQAICHEDVMECMRVFCNDQSIDISLRLLVLEELKNSFKNMDEKDLILLLGRFLILFF